MLFFLKKELTKENIYLILKSFPKENEQKRTEGGLLMTVDHLRIKAERIAKGLTQDEMAKALGWSDRARYAKRENGIVSFNADELIKVATTLGFTKDQIGIFFTESVH